MNVIRPKDRFQAALQVLLFVLHRDEDRDQRSSEFGRVRTRRNLAGDPATMFHGSTLRVTKEHAPTIAPSPICTPASTKTRAPTNALSPTVIFAVTRAILGSLKS